MSASTTPSTPATGSGEAPDEAALRQAVGAVPDPEIPVLSIADLGIVREVQVDPATGVARVAITPTYSGCPAMEAIRRDVEQVVTSHGLVAEVTTRLRPAWTTDWMSARGRESLRRWGIAPPGERPADRPGRPLTVGIARRQVTCPTCGSSHTEQISRFGSTACKALRRCRDCREPFEEFKAI